MSFSHQDNTDASDNQIVVIQQGADVTSVRVQSTAVAGTEVALVTRNIPGGTQAISAASLPLPTGASTSANQTTGNASLSSIDTKLTTTNASLAAIDAGTPAALGQATMANSMPVVVASNQSPIPTNLVNGANTTGVSANSEVYANDTARTAGAEATLNLTTSAVVAAAVGGVNLANRKYLILSGASSNNVRYGLSTSCLNTLFRDQTIIFPFGINVYVKMSTGTGTVVVSEAS